MIWWITATLLAFFIKGLCGFANTLVFTSVMGFHSNNINISPVELLLGYPTNIILAIKERKSIDWKICLPLAGLVILGSIPGIFLLKNANTEVIKIVCGVVIVTIGCEMLFREFHPGKTHQSNLVLILIGILSGVLCGLYGIGALLGAYITRVTKDSHAFKANICFVFFVENTFRVILYSLWGIITWNVLKQAAVLLPVALLGLYIGMLCSKEIDEKHVKRLVIILLIISGLSLVVKSVTGM